MLVKEALALARQWVLEEAAPTPGFWGAFYHGSAAWLPGDTPLPATSDVDVIVVLAGSQAPPKLGKIRYHEVLLDVSYLPREEVQAPEQVLGQAHLAGSLRTANVIVDPSGQLTTLQAAVARDFAQRRWVVQRCGNARDRIMRNLQGLNVSEAAPFHDQVLPWLFATGVTTHVLLVAGLENPTVRRRYVAVRELLAAYGRLDLYPTLLELLGCAWMGREQVEEHLAALTEVFDVAKAVIQTPVFFASDLSDAARPIAIDGSRELIARGDHREAIFWIVATYSRCQTVLYHDAPMAVQERFTPGYRRLLGDLGIASFADLQRRGEEVKALLPRIWAAAEAIMAANPAIDDTPKPI